MSYGVLHSVWTVVLLLIFLGIVAWAWSSKRRKGFDEAARLAVDGDEAITLVRPGKGVKHG